MSDSDAADALGVSKTRIRQLKAAGLLVDGGIKATVTVASVIIRQSLIRSGHVRRGRPWPKKKGSK